MYYIDVRVLRALCARSNTWPSLCTTPAVCMLLLLILPWYNSTILEYLLAFTLIYLHLLGPYRYAWIAHYIVSRYVDHHGTLY